MRGNKPPLIHTPSLREA